MKRGPLVVGVAVAVACTPIRPVPLSSAPVNTCPCDHYDATASSTAPRCQAGRCEIATAGNRPEFPFWIVVNVPDTSIYAPDSTYVLFSDEKGSPTFTRKAPVGTVTRCVAPLCISLGGLTLASGTYTVSSSVSLHASYPLADGAAIPVRVEYAPIGSADQSPFPALPLEPTLTFPVLSDGIAEFSTALPTGIYQRIMYPEAPFDAVFPPRADTPEQVGTPSEPSSNFVDEFVLDDKSLDPPVGRTVTVSRDEGLDGWQVSVVDQITLQRISTLKTLSGTTATVLLDTTGQQRANGGGLGNDVEVVVAPPASYLAVPTFVNPVFGGQQFDIDYPFVPAPVAVEGVVAEPGTGQLFGYQAHLTFTSTSITTPRAAQPMSTLLHYATDVDTDDHGRFSTVLPPGTYDVITEPAEGTGYAKTRSTANVDHSPTALTLQPPARTKVTGKVKLTDGRPLADADLLLLPQDPPSTSTTPKPRPGHSHTENDGSYVVELDPGPYVLTVVPKVGSGFPRVVTRPTVGADAVQLDDILVPPPTPLSFTIKDPTRGFENPVTHAVVRIFAIPGVTEAAHLADAGNPPPVEIGEAMTDVNGLVEILLAPGPR